MACYAGDVQLQYIWKEMIRSYFTATTGIVISLYLVCLLFYPDGAFSPPDIGRILLTAFFCTLPCVAIFLLKKPAGNEQSYSRPVI